MSLLNQLWILADEIYGSGAVAPGLLFGECGLYLERPLKRLESPATPLNSLTFASTGGDGVHYGFLQLPPSSMEEQPVVMTVPAIGENLVVAESLREFLGLGYFVGWFSFENLAYDQQEAVEYLTNLIPTFGRNGRKKLRFSEVV